MRVMLVDSDCQVSSVIMVAVNCFLTLILYFLLGCVEDRLPCYLAKVLSPTAVDVLG